MILFKTVRYKNLLSTGNVFTEITLDTHQNTLVMGANGSGKSTLLEALCFGLFGKPFRNINKPKLVNSINKGNTLVEVEFNIGSNAYLVRRGIKPNIFEIYLNGVLVDQESKALDYQEYFEKFVLKMNMKTFTQVVVLGVTSFVPFMELKLPERRVIVDDVLDIEIFSIMGKRVKVAIDTNKQNTDANKHEIHVVKEKIALTKKHISQLEEDRTRGKEVLEQKITDQLTYRASLERDKTVVELEMEALRERFRDKTEVQEKLSRLKTITYNLTTKKNVHEKNRQFWTTTTVCPSCDSPIDQNKSANAIAKIDGDLTTTRNNLVVAEEKNKVLSARLSEIAAIEKQLGIAIDRMHQLRVAIETTDNLIRDLERQKNSLTSDSASLQQEQKNLQEFETTLLTLDSVRNGLFLDRRYYDVMELLLKDSGIKTKIVQQYLPIMNKLINKYLAEMDFFVNFELNEAFEETIKSRFRDEFSYESFSEGEKQRIDMALMLTWREIAKLKNSAYTNLLVLDEIFDSSLDAVGVDYIIKVLNSLDHCNLFVISHKSDTIVDRFRNVIKFEKQGNYSRIVP